MRCLLFSLLALLGSASLAADNAFSPRGTVEAVAQAVQEHYFDAAKGARLAGQLRAAAQGGELDRQQHPAELAAELTRRLQPEDAHFTVLHSPAPPSATRPGPGGLSPDELRRRSNHGFRRVEILPGNIGYIVLGGFAAIDFAAKNDIARQRADAVLALTRDADALIVDLRQSPGGAPEMVGYLVSAFLPAGLDPYNVFHSRAGQASEAPAEPYAQPRPEQPLYLLVSGRTASAAEAFAYTLQAAKRAVVIGEASAGAANPGGMIPVGGGFSVFVSAASPINPLTGGNWEGSGVIPEHPVAPAEALGLAQRLALQGLLAADEASASRRDWQWALQALQPAGPSRSDLASLVGHYTGLRVAMDAGVLQVIRGRRARMVLQEIGVDQFAVLGDSTLRVTFLRDSGQRPLAVVLDTAAGRQMRYAREP